MIQIDNKYKLIKINKIYKILTMNYSNIPMDILFFLCILSLK